MTEKYVVISKSTGAVRKAVDVSILEYALSAYKLNGELYLGIWELRWSPWETHVIQARITPRRDFGPDDNWRSCLYEFQLRNV